MWFCCRSACSGYYAVDCIIREGGKNGTPVGSIKKKLASNILEFMGDADTYVVEFPPSATPEDKLSLIMAGLFIDYRYFESNASNNGKSYVSNCAVTGYSCPSGTTLKDTNKCYYN